MLLVDLLKTSFRYSSVITLSTVGLVAFENVAQAVTINLGELASDGTIIIEPGNIGDFFEFSISGDINDGDGSYLNISTLEQGFLDPNPGLDTIIGLYDLSGTQIAFDDDGLSLGGGSVLSFGDSDPLTGGTSTSPGADGLLGSGMYTLVVGEFFDFSAGTALADINLDNFSGTPLSQGVQFSAVFEPTNNQSVPEPTTTLAILGIGAAGIIQRKRSLSSKEGTSKN
ncbi:MAG: PEP-CTERM sorting domain-containing protein [Crocosphaera sp.]